MTHQKNRRLNAIRVNQWLPGWNKVSFDGKEHRSKPEPYFYIFSIPAAELRSLSGISRRQAKNASPRTADLGIQRQHDADRSDEIRRFVEFGYPWSTLSEQRRKSSEFNDLRKPGWLPTSIVINILRPSDSRTGGASMDGADAVTIEQGDGGTSLVLPYDKWTKEWKPKSLPPFEVIDGQHRLWAFDEEDAENFELPVVAFFGLDISWQAYLFWTINIKPKRINSSLAFDLYPLLRSEDWLDRAEGHFVYRETRSQELTEALWAHPTSPWYDHINMLGERQVEGVSQSAWIKSLMATFVRPWDGRGKQLGGLFGARLKQDGDVLGWSRAQQAAFLILSWKLLHEAVWRKHNGWAHRLRTDQRDGDGQVTQKSDPAFYGSYSLISTDQGVRGFMHVVNDLCFYRAAKLKLDMWKPEERAAANENEAVDSSLRNLQKLDLAKFLGQIAEALSDFDWRTSSTPSLEEPLRRSKLVFRGGSGYKELRRQLLEHLASSEGELKDAAARVLELV